MFDLIVIGGGPGGYLAAERAGARKMKVLLIEKEELGGVCLNWGCIPTKTLLNAAKIYLHGIESEQFGVSFDNPRFDLEKAMKWKDKTVTTLVKGVAYQMKRHHVEVVKGKAVFTGPKTVEVNGTSYEGGNIIIATGSDSVMPPIPGAGSGKVVTSKEMLSLTQMPGRLAVIGGGVIGLEFASLFSCLGVEVRVIEMMPEILPFMDGEISKQMRREMKDRITFHLGCKVERIEGGKVIFSAEGKEESVDADLVLMAVGRRPVTNDMGFETIGLDVGPKGIKVDERMRTNLPGVYAVGDVTGESLLAHSAYRMGEVAVADIAGETGRMRYSAVPSVVYTLPEAAGVGLTGEAAEQEGRKVKTATLQMRANGRFLAEHGSANGLCKVVVDADTDVLVGVHLLGGVCSEIIWGAAAMIEAELRVQDMKEIIYPHPTVSEIVKDTLWELV